MAAVAQISSRNPLRKRLLLSESDIRNQRKLRMAQQSNMGDELAQYAENWRLRLGRVVFIGVNVQGSNDNYPYFGVNGESRSEAEIERMRAEATARKAAVLLWLGEGFEYAKRVHAVGVMVVMQANLNFNNERHQDDTRLWDAFPDYVNALRDESMHFQARSLSFTATRTTSTWTSPSIRRVVVLSLLVTAGAAAGLRCARMQGAR